MSRKLLATLICLLVVMCLGSTAGAGAEEIWAGGKREVEFVPGCIHTVALDRTGLIPVLRIYEGAVQVFETKVTPGVYGPMALASLREGRTDLVVLLSAGSADALNEFLIVGVKADGAFGILADRSLIKGWQSRTRLVELDGRVGLEFSPFGLWTRYRINVAWDEKTEKMTATEPVRVSYPGEPPTADKVVLFNLPVPYKSRVRMYADGADVSEVRLRPGERLLLRRDAATAEEINVSCFYNDTTSVIEMEAIDGNTLITAKKPGETTMTLAQPHFAGDTFCLLRIIVE
jgi:hypothetical protein